MGVIENRRFCPDCGRQTWHVSRRFSPECAFLLALLTGGLFLLVWFVISIMERNQPWICRDCSSADIRRGRRAPKWLVQRRSADVDPRARESSPSNTAPIRTPTVREGSLTALPVAAASTLREHKPAR
ncbi:MAG: hypothetical protein C4547_15265 [Phycisphaerales bacterium]|nr:MAG: hypothetical protein C4547_15265 [Phycisphaerales bacterium]